MKPLLWRIAGCLCYVLPPAAMLWLWSRDFASPWQALFVIMGCIIGGIIIIVGLFFLMGIGDRCFDKAKRPPR